MLHLAYFVLLAWASWLNRKDWPMLALTLVVGVSLFLPTPREYDAYYRSCITVEIIVALVALRLNVAASVLIIELCTLLVLAHILGYYTDGNPPFSPYRFLVKELETLEILCCALKSAPLASRLRNRDIL